ncbi:50S ribosomal protein L35, chloroplastic [Punica granatum]|uniref:50S ribosomal protein L35 n=2 Tax=Punica granatum TaxID=22663 RepID=A0A218W001_PUNGR|nr:50S ribosomal protein L35, chloroplastic [Punica granatum]OWM65849.1 hypothetical protein CDL15_Pgr015274 [Punica granatum]PKI52379.1 hypothetical protein CRG98_027305 [Punica granatum]
MASASLTLSSFNLRLPPPTGSSSSARPSFSLLQLNTPLNQKGTASSLRLSSARSISGFPSVSTNRLCSISPLTQKLRTLTIVSAKGYKMKTHKASAKRFRVTGRGKIVRRRAGKQHLLAKKNTKRKLRLSKVVQVSRSDYDNVIGALPYLKVKRQAK